MGDDREQRRNGRTRVTIDLLRELAASLDALTNAASPHAGLNRTDIRALDIIAMRQGLTAGQLASRLKLTTGAITGVLDRLERAGCARRTHDHGDRRRVVIQPTPEAKRLGCITFKTLVDDLERLLASYPEAERQLIDGFLLSLNAMIARRADELSHN